MREVNPMNDITMTLEDTYKEIEVRIQSIKEEIDDIQSLIDNNDFTVLSDVMRPETLRLTINDALLQVDAFTLEQDIRQLDIRKNQHGQKIDEDIQMRARAAMLAANDLRLSLKESGYLSDEKQEPDKEAMQETISIIKNEFINEMEELKKVNELKEYLDDTYYVSPNPDIINIQNGDD